MGPAGTTFRTSRKIKDDLKSNFKDDLKINFEAGLAFSKNLETYPFNKEDEGNHVAFEWTHICCSVLILVPPPILKAPNSKLDMLFSATIIFKIITRMKLFFSNNLGVQLQLSGVFRMHLHHSYSFLVF